MNFGGTNDLNRIKNRTLSRYLLLRFQSFPKSSFLKRFKSELHGIIVEWIIAVLTI